jgi:hypothetical protein
MSGVIRRVGSWFLVSLILLTTSCDSSRAVAKEGWTLVKVMTQGESIQPQYEVAELRNCGVVEPKTTTCEAGTSNELTATVGGAVVFGEGVQGSVEASVSNALGVNRTSGEALPLEPPPTGSIYRYPVTKEYRILAGKVSAVSPKGEQVEADYTFQASCSIHAQPPEVVPCPGNTAEPSSPPSTPHTGSCPDGQTCYNVQFDQLDPALWCKAPPSGLSFDTGSLVAVVQNDQTYEIHPCEALSWKLRFVEVTLSILEAEGQDWSAHAGVGGSLGNDQYVYLLLDVSGNAYLTVGTHNQSPVTQTMVPHVGIGKTHTLRLEYTGTEVLSYVDGALLDRRFPLNDYGSWFLLTLSAYPDSRIKAQFDRVLWGIEHP